MDPRTLRQHGLRPIVAFAGPLVLLIALVVPQAHAAGGAYARSADMTPAAGEDPLPCDHQDVTDRCEIWVGEYGTADPEGPYWYQPIGGIAVSPVADRIYQVGRRMEKIGHPIYRPPGADPSDQGDGVVTLAYDGDGVVLWQAEYDGPDKLGDVPQDVVVSPDGRYVYVTGYSDVPGDGSYNHIAFVVAYDAVTGEQVWTARYDGDGSDAYSAAIGRSIDVSPDGTQVYLTGTAAPQGQGPSTRDYFTLALNAVPPQQPGDPELGATLWDAFYAGERVGGTDRPWEILASPDGRRVFVTGAGGGAVGWDYVTIAYSAGPQDTLGDPEPGTELWVATYGDPEEEEDWPYGGMTVSPDGSLVFVSGASDRDGAEEWATVAYDAVSGAQVWHNRYSELHLPETAGFNRSPAAEALDIEVSPDGQHVFVVGFVGQIDNNVPGVAVIVAYESSTGEPQWERRYTPRPYGSSKPFDVAVSPDGRSVYMAVGNFETNAHLNSRRVTTLAYETTSGDIQWMADYEPGPTHLTSGLGDPSYAQLLTSADGRHVYVSAKTASGWETCGCVGMTLLAYDAA